MGNHNAITGYDVEGTEIRVVFDSESFDLGVLLDFDPADGREFEGPVSFDPDSALRFAARLITHARRVEKAVAQDEREYRAREAAREEARRAAAREHARAVAAYRAVWALEFGPSVPPVPSC